MTGDLTRAVSFYSKIQISLTKKVDKSKFKFRKINFKNKKRILQAELAINIIITLILLIISGLGMTMYFIVFWLIISALCYYLYSNNHEKLGFIGTAFCTFFLCIFLILQLWIYGTSY